MRARRLYVIVISMSFYKSPRETPIYTKSIQTVLGAEFQNQSICHSATVEVVCDKKPPETLKVEPEVFLINENSEINIVKKVYESLENKSLDIRYLKVTLDDKKTIFYDGQTVFYSYPFVINCAHRHYNPDLSEQENKELYYKCFYPHGHEYQLFITVKSDKNFEFDQLIQWGDTIIVKPFDKSFLNYKMGNTSGELILEFFSKQLESNPSNHLKLVSLTLKETFKNSFVKVYENDLHYLF